ncbi:MAG: glycosyltransferase family 2 protein [Candidatus Babeliales bacterium]
MLRWLINFRALFLLLSLGIKSLAHAHDTNDERPLVISICAYNCSSWVLQNLDSIFSQNYKNFRVIYIDDGSLDTTVEQVEKYRDEHALSDKITLIANPVRVGKLKNIYHAFHTCKDTEIIVQVDGDDWLPTTHIFERINQAYQEQDVWLTYSDFYVHPEGTKEWCVPQPVPDHIKQKRAYRNWKWVFTHLRTFYAWLYKSVKLEDFITELSPGFEGKFFPICNDMAAFFPMLEMCGPHFSFIPEKLYVYNRDNPILGAKLYGHLYKPIGEDVRKREKYPLVEKPKFNHLASLAQAQAHLIILSNGILKDLSRIISSLNRNASDIKRVTVVLDKKTAELQTFAKKHASTHFVYLTQQSCNEALSSIVQKSSESHVIIAKDAIFIEQPIDIRACINELETTQAHAFYLGFMHTNMPFYNPETKREIVPHQHIWNNVYAWKFRIGYDRLCNNLDMTLFTKNTFIKRLQSLPEAQTVCSFIDAWQQCNATNQHEVGLFYDNAKLGGNLSLHTHANYTACLPIVPTHISMKEYVMSLLQINAQLFNKEYNARY